MIASGEKLKEAQDAGADFVGGDDMVAKIQEGWLDFDAVVATPEMMKSVGRLGKVLGPRGLMPNPKTGHGDLRRRQGGQGDQGRARSSSASTRPAIVHAPVGKVSFGPEKLLENAKTLIDSVIKARPAAAKGRYVKSIALSSTMGPGVRVDLASVEGHA